MTKTSDFKISYISDWMPVSQIPTTRSVKYNLLNKAHGTTGVYQVALTKHLDDIGSELVHSKIGYTGKSNVILDRTYSIRAPKGTHGASRYIRQEGLDRDNDVCIRYIYCDESSVTALENNIFDETFSKFGYRFLWADASAGTSGKYSLMIDLANGLSADELLNAIMELKELAIEKNQAEFLQKMEETISR